MLLRVFQPAKKKGIGKPLQGQSQVVRVHLAEHISANTFFQYRSQLLYQFVIELANVLIEAGLDVETRAPRFSKIEAHGGNAIGKNPGLGGDIVPENSRDVVFFGKNTT